MASHESAPGQQPFAAGASASEAPFSWTWMVRGGTGAPVPRLPRDLDIPDRIAHYRLGNSLGRGAFGRVFEAVDTLTGASVALKLVPENEQERVQALHLEAEWLASINRPNVPKIFGQGTAEGYAWLAIELVEGRSLAEIIAALREELPSTAAERTESKHSPSSRRRTRRTWLHHDPDPRVREIMGWFRDLARTLHDLHELGVIHRDIKPANIVIHKDGLPYLIDFGLGIDDFDASGQGLYLAGTVPYMSPEQAGGGTMGLGPESDLYSLAVTFHEALTGQRVFQHPRGAAALHDIQFQEVPQPSTVSSALPSSLDPIFTQACRKDPELRYADGATLAEDIEAWLANRPTPHAPESARTRRRRWVHRGLGAVALLLLVVTAAWVGLRIRDRERALDEIRAAIDLKDYERALDACLRHAPRYGRDRRFLDLYDSAESKSATARIHDFLTVLGVSPGKPQPESRVGRSYRQARRHLRFLSTPGLRLIAAMGAHLEGRPEEALGLLAPRGEGSLAEEEMRAICYLHRPEDTALFFRQLEVIEAHPDARLRGTNEHCIEAWRMLAHANNASYQDRREELGDPDSQYAGARSILQLILNKDPHHGAALALMANLELNTGDWAQSRERYLELAHRIEPGSTPADRLGPYYYAGKTCILVASQAEGDRRNELVEQALQYLRPVLRHDRTRLWELIESLHFRGLLPAWIGARQLLRADDPFLATAPDRTVKILGVLSRDMCKKLEPRAEKLKARRWLAEILATLWTPKRGPDAMKCIRGAQSYYLWMLREDLDAALEAVRRDGDAKGESALALRKLARHVCEYGDRIEKTLGLERDGRYLRTKARFCLAIDTECEDRESMRQACLQEIDGLITDYERCRETLESPRLRRIVDEILQDLKKIKEQMQGP